MADVVSPLVSGSAAGVASTVIGAPLDTLKVRLQTSTHFNGFTDCLFKSIKNESVLGLYKGTSPAVFSAVLENSAVFFANSILKHAYYGQHVPTSPSFQESCIFGGLSGIFSATAICPAETVKCTMQAKLSTHIGANMVSHRTRRRSRDSSLQNFTMRTANKPKITSSPLKTAREIAKIEGLRGLFKGLPAQYARDVPFCFAFFGGYEGVCGLLSTFHKCDRENLSSMDLVFAGGLAGAFGWSLSLPMDNVKSVMQTKSSGQSFVNVAKTIYKDFGVVGFYRDYTAAVVRAFPVNGVLFLTYETMEKLLST